MKNVKCITRAYYLRNKAQSNGKFCHCSFQGAESKCQCREDSKFSYCQTRGQVYFDALNRVPYLPRYELLNIPHTDHKTTRA